MPKKDLMRCLLLLLCVLAFGGPAAVAQSPEPTVDRLAAPVMPDNPTQADLGAEVYYQTCMSCHGDRGQGLTDEWREAWPLEDKNCWQGKCHAANYPPGGFELVRYVPPIVGEGLLDRFQNAALLQGYIGERMPWEKPGSLTEDEYWQVTAYLLQANGLNQDKEPLGPQNAAGISLVAADSQGTAGMPEVTTPEVPPPDRSNPSGWLVMVMGVLIAAVLVVAGIWLLQRAGS
jgi:mono/diheme cytochrome c family protein